MTLQQADAIKQDWAKFLEITNGRLMSVFLAKIPQSLLPYHKEVILEALAIIVMHFEEGRNEEAVRSVKATIPLLDNYIDDEEAISEASKNFADNNYIEAIKKYFGKDQEKQYEYILSNF